MLYPDKAIIDYCTTFSSPPCPVLTELERETHLRTLSPQMCSGALQGQLLRLISKIAAPRGILEIGTFTGYSAICLAGGLSEGGFLHTIEINPELAIIIKKYLKKAALQSLVKLHIGDALMVIPQLQESFDLVYLDGAKKDYCAYYDLIFEKINPGGLILADNVLWGGKVVRNKKDADTLAVAAFNRKIREDDRVENIILPIRDGISIIRKL